MEAGKLRERITLVTNGPAVRDGRGGFTPGPETSELRWARVQPAKGIEVLRLQQVTTEQVYTVTLRMPVEIATSMRVRWKGKTLAIHSLVEDERSRQVTVTCFDSGK